MRFQGVISPFVFLTLFLSLAESKFYRPFQFNQYKSGLSQQHDEGKPTGRHKNHCAYVVEKTVSFSLQDGAAPYVKAEYNKCSWGQKCPTLQYRLLYKPIYKVAHKTVTELEWRCCPGYSGYGCMEGHPFYQHHMKMMPPFKGPSMKGPPYKGPMFKGPMFKGPPMVRSNPLGYLKGPPPSSFNSYPGRHFGLPRSSTHPETAFEPYPSEPEENPEHQEPHHTDQDQTHEHEHEHGPEEHGPEGHGPEEHRPEEHGPEGHGPEEHGPEGHGPEEHRPEEHRPEEHRPEEHGPEEHGPEEHGPEEHGPEEHGPEEHGPGEHGPEEHLPEKIHPPSSGGEHPEDESIGQALNSETEERLYRMEEDVQRLNQGLETLRGTVNGLEDSLRASLREDANRMLSALLSAAPGPVPAPAMASSPSSVGFVEIPLGDPETGDLDGRNVFPGLTELNGRIEELRTELQSKSGELRELRATVMGHGGALRKTSNGTALSESTSSIEGTAVEKLMDAKLSEARTEILGGFEKRIESAEGRCEEKAGDVHRQCQREQGERQEQMEDALAESSTKMRTELRNLQAEMQSLKASEDCSGPMSGLVERVQLLETSMVGLNQSQRHLRVELGAHKDHIEGMLAGRLEYVESKLNATGTTKSQVSGRWTGVLGKVVNGSGLEARMEGKMKALEGRLLTAVEELVNATAPALLEGLATPTLETQLESLRERLEVDVDRLQKQLSSLEILCNSSCSSPQNRSAIEGESPGPSGNQADENFNEALDIQRDRLNSLNVTLQQIQKLLPPRKQQEQAPAEYPTQGEVTILRFNVRSVNHTLRDLQDSLGSVIHQVSQANSSWHEREGRLAQQMKGVVQLVGHQASMLSAGERRLTRLKGELQEMRRRLAQAVQGCRSTAMGVQKEVTEVGGRVASVEDRCKGLNFLAEDLERIREELEGQSNGLLLQVNGTLSSHAQQLSELRGELRNCTSKANPTPSSEPEAQTGRGDTFALN